MSDELAKLYDKPWFDRLFKVSIAIKGFDGLVELVAGIALLISPGLVHWVLNGVGVWFVHRHVHLLQIVGEYMYRVDDDFSRSGLGFLIIFLVSHGVVKLALVYCLLKKIVWAYPYAIVLLLVFLIYQIYLLITQPSIGMALFAILDVIIIVLVYGEYRKLKTEAEH